jgi:alginate O-acetyltransferase complex protein AlgI
MTFTSLTFLLFLPVVWTLYWWSPRQSRRNVVIVVASYFFYGWWDYRFAILMLATSLLDFYAARLIAASGDPRFRRACLLASCGANLAVLGYFKYFNFFAANLQALAARAGIHLGFVAVEVLLPAGISFYTFQAMSYTIAVYRGQLGAVPRLVDYLAFISFFPHLVAGPIMRATHLLPQFTSERHFDEAQAADGLRQMLWGFFKKMALADNLAPTVDQAFRDVTTQSGPTLAYATLAFAFQIYFDFSAYSDIAIGCARLFGVNLMRNFAYPYFSQSMAEFWRRWHISLSTWFADFVYVPLGGGRVPPLRHAANVLITFLLSGLWHGASWNFVIWGAMNGVAVLPAALRKGARRIGAEDVPGGERDWPGIVVLARMLGTFLIVCLAWVFFRASTLPQALEAVRRILATLVTPVQYSGFALPAEYHSLVCMVVATVAVEWLGRRRPHPLQFEGWSRPVRWLVYTLVIWLSLYWAPAQTGKFIYFQF